MVDDDEGAMSVLLALEFAVARTRSMMMLAVISTGTHDTVSWDGSSVGILPRYFELAMTCESTI